MAKIRNRKPRPKTRLGWTALKKRLKKVFNVDAILHPLQAPNHSKRRVQASGKGASAQAKGQKERGAAAALAGAFLLGTVLNRERQQSAAKANHAHAHAQRHATPQTAEKHRAAVQDKPGIPPEPQPDQQGPSPRGHRALIVLIVIALGVIGLFWLNAHLAPANMLHFSLHGGGQGTHFLQFTLQQGRHSLLQVNFGAIQILLVLTIAVVETLIVGLWISDRATPLRLVAGLCCALLGIWVFTAIVPLVWKGDYSIGGVPFFTTILGALIALVVFHLLRGGAPGTAGAALPPASPPTTQHGPVATPPAAASPGAPSAALPGVQLLFHSQRAGIDPSLVEQLVAFILATEHSLDGAVYDLRHPQVLQALATVARSKRLRLAVDAGKGRLGADPKPSGNQEALQQAGLSSHATSVHEGSHLMHDKFLIRDGRTIWTGSANFTSGGLGLQDNNCLIIDSPELAQQYETTFLDLLSSHHEHGAVKGRRVMGQPVRLGEATITPGFAPAAGDGIEEMIISLLKDARRVRILAFLIGDAGILQALEQVKHADVKGIYDPSGMEDVLRSSRQDRSHFWFLHDSRFVAAPSHAFHQGGEQDFMHNKVFIINDEWVVTGSYNFSENAEANDENVLQIHSPVIAAAYNRYFDALYTLYRQHPGHLKEPQRPQRHSPGKRGGRKRQARWPEVLHLFQRR